MISAPANFDMDGVTKDKLPKMITAAQDPFDDSEADMHKAAEEAYTYILNAPGTILKVFILAVTNDNIADATARLELLGRGGLEQELETRFAFELGKRNEEYKAAGKEDVKAQDAAANAKAAGGGLWAGPVSKALRPLVDRPGDAKQEPVSYTHLTLPTKA